MSEADTPIAVVLDIDAMLVHGRDCSGCPDCAGLDDFTRELLQRARDEILEPMLEPEAHGALRVLDGGRWLPT